jgi:hypothetical protein
LEHGVVKRAHRPAKGNRVRLTSWNRETDDERERQTSGDANDHENPELSPSETNGSWIVDDFKSVLHRHVPKNGSRDNAIGLMLWKQKKRESAVSKARGESRHPKLSKPDIQTRTRSGSSKVQLKDSKRQLRTEVERVTGAVELHAGFVSFRGGAGTVSDWKGIQSSQGREPHGPRRRWWNRADGPAHKEQKARWLYSGFDFCIGSQWLELAANPQNGRATTCALFLAGTGTPGGKPKWEWGTRKAGVGVSTNWSLSLTLLSTDTVN